MWYYFLYEDKCIARFSHLHESTFNQILIVMSWTFIEKCLNELKLDLYKSQDITTALCLVMTLVLISFLLFFLHLACHYSISTRVPLSCIIINQINKLPEDGLKSLPEKPHYIENTWISQKIKIKLYFSYTLLRYMNLCVCSRLVCQIRAGGGLSEWGWGWGEVNCLKYLEMG